MSPEQCRGAGTVDKDGCLCAGLHPLSAINGTDAFLSEGAGELMALQMFQAVLPVRSLNAAVHPEIATYVERLLPRTAPSVPACARSRRPWPS